jgi:hypothetical protein
MAADAMIRRLDTRAIGAEGVVGRSTASSSVIPPSIERPEISPPCAPRATRPCSS